MTEISDILNRLEYLETKVAFQDDTIEALNQEIAEQQNKIETLRSQMQFLVQKMKDGHVENQVASEAEETPPPHY
ncbi:SlyX family protein [Motilimonas pumila]|uniref:Protein SlyX homolog n=1 Tax=Motilimonas pumila TaxID=2303987 RepID=A0A418YF37_9GAMM|nr:SlyX family protein [Motilimonas pumila]RJG47892.1 SlyX family protein [Motilimonas pumila]